MTTHGNSPPAGWYSDPSGHHAWRWWDGQRWTEHTSTPSQPPAAAQPIFTGVSPFAAFENEHDSAPWAKRALLVYVALVVIGAGLIWLAEPSLHASYTQLRFRLDHPNAGTSLSRTALPVGYRIWAPIEGLISIAGFVLFLVWQHRAATMARALGYPARRSPALGVGGWFIPICNFWFPYQAIRDCLPPGHPGRRMVLHMWLWYVASLCISVVTVVVLFSGSTVVAVALRDVGSFATVIYASLAFRTVDFIYSTHRQVLYPHEPTDPDGVTVVLGPVPS